MTSSRPLCQIPFTLSNLEILKKTLILVLINYQCSFKVKKSSFIDTEETKRTVRETERVEHVDEPRVGVLANISGNMISYLIPLIDLVFFFFNFG